MSQDEESEVYVPGYNRTSHLIRFADDFDDLLFMNHDTHDEMLELGGIFSEEIGVTQIQITGFYFQTSIFKTVFISHEYSTLSY